jgi:hypothetical protein
MKFDKSYFWNQMTYKLFKMLNNRYTYVYLLSLPKPKNLVELTAFKSVYRDF